MKPNPDLDADYWNQRYQHQETGWDVGEISTPLKTYFDQLTKKELKILIPGAGNAYEAEYLFRLGFKNVYVCDFAATPLQKLKERIPEFASDQLIESDFFELKKKNFDLIIEQTFFCALNPNLRKKYFQKMNELLVPGGRLVGLLFDDPLNSDQPPFGGNRGEYLNYFQDLFTIHTYNECYNSIQPRSGRELFINLVKK